MHFFIFSGLAGLSNTSSKKWEIIFLFVQLHAFYKLSQDGFFNKWKWGTEEFSLRYRRFYATKFVNHKTCNGILVHVLTNIIVIHKLNTVLLAKFHYNIQNYMWTHTSYNNFFHVSKQRSVFVEPWKCFPQQKIYSLTCKILMLVYFFLLLVCILCCCLINIMQWNIFCMYYTYIHPMTYWLWNTVL
jgi:hypothetical protein